MPDLGITEILAIASLALGAGSTAYSLKTQSDAGGGPSASQNQAAQAASQAQAAQAAAQKQQAINASLGNAQERTGGSLSDSGLTNLATLLAGYGGQTGGAAPSGATPSSSTSSGPGLQDALTQLTSGSGSTPSNFTGGGSAPTPDTPGSQLSNPFAGA